MLVFFLSLPGDDEVVCLSLNREWLPPFLFYEENVDLSGEWRSARRALEPVAYPLVLETLSHFSFFPP